MKKVPSLGAQEMDILKYISEHPPLSVRQVAEHFEKQKNLARTTVLTVMERLRKKGFLSRAKVEGIFKYSAKFQTGDVLSSKISDFIETTLGGSFSPLLSFFSDSNLSSQEIQQLKTLAKELEKKKGAESAD